MSDDVLIAAKAAYRRGSYSEALELARKAPRRGTEATAERDCLICDCLQYSGNLAEARTLALAGLDKSQTPDRTARYWEVLGRIELEQLHHQAAAKAFRNGLRAAEKGDDLQTLASVQQLWLITAGPTLGSGLTPAVREAYRTAVRSAEATALAGFHIRLSRLEGQSGAFDQALHHLSLAKSLLERAPHLALKALYHVNNACVLALTGSFVAARKSAELGATLAEQAGHRRLSMAGAATASYIAISTGEVSIAESWLRVATKAAKQLGITEVGLLDSLACLALLQGDLDKASEHLARARDLAGTMDFRWSNSTEALCLLTELYLHKRQGNHEERLRILGATREASNRLGDKHLDNFTTLAEADACFDEKAYASAIAKLRQLTKRSPHLLVYQAELSRLMARELWLAGRLDSARRHLTRATSISLTRSSRLGWAEALRELRSLKTTATYDEAYSLQLQQRQAVSKFAPLTRNPHPTWYESTAAPSTVVRDPVDGFTDASAVLLMAGDAELRGREALATLVDLGVCTKGALINHGTSGLKVLASIGFPRSLLATDAPVTRMQVGRHEDGMLELVLKPANDLRGDIAVAGMRRILEAAEALESQKKNQQRLGALWQPEDIIEEPGAIFASSLMIELMLTARKVAPTRLPVLLLGPTGTGKEVIAHAIHRASGRSSKVFLPFNCSAVPRDMMESQLFGYRRGSFTGATDDFPGIIRSAEGGTLFLDEIGELPIDLQPKLLRFLETNEVHPLGEGRPIKVDVRVVAATNARLDDLVDQKTFREDLYYRLNIVRFHMPRLAERREEIPALATHMLREAQLEENKHSIKISDEVMEYLLLYKWPGNIRQLSNEMRRMVAMVESNDTLTAEHLTPAIRKSRKTIAVSDEPDDENDDERGETTTAAAAAAPANSMAVALEQPLPEAVEALERAMIEHAMTRAGGKIEEAARLLGISRKGLFLKRRRWLDIDPSETDV